MPNVDYSSQMPVLIVEDDDREVERISKCFETYGGASIVGRARTAEEGLKFMAEHRPEGVILDITLENNSYGGDFLSGLDRMKLPIRPAIIVVTWSKQNYTHNYLAAQGIERFFYKYDEKYATDGPKRILEHFMNIRPYIHKSITIQTLAPELTEGQLEDIRLDRIRTFLTDIGGKPSSRSFHYMQYALLAAAESGHAAYKLVDIYESVRARLALRGTAIVKTGLTRFLNGVWNTKNEKFNDLLKLYKLPIGPKKGAPDMADFVNYFGIQFK